MAKKVWISFPLTTTADLKDDAVVAFLKGGQKKELEIEVAAFVTKWVMDKDIPFGVDFDSCGVDRTVVIESLPKRLQKILGATVPVIAEPGEVARSEDAAEGTEAGAVEQVDDGEDADATAEAAGLSGDDGVMDGSSELR